MSYVNDTGAADLVPTPGKLPPSVPLRKLFPTAPQAPHGPLGHASNHKTEEGLICI